MKSVLLYWKRFAMIGALLSLTLGTIQAQESAALLDALVKKGILSDQEAEDIRADMVKEDAKSPASKLLISKSVKQLEFYGDGRLRFENIDQHNHYAAVTVYDRERYRLRIGANYTYSDHLKAGVELASGTNDSGNQTFGSIFSKPSIGVSKVFIKYDPADWLSLTAGKFANPLYTTTDIVYSQDLNPEGGVEGFTFHPTDNLSVGLTAAQFIYAGNNESNLTPAKLNNNDVWIFAEQVPVIWNITDNISFRITPGFSLYSGGGNTNFDGGVSTTTNVSGNTATVYAANANSTVDPVFISSREANDLAVLSAPGEFNFKLGALAIRPYWDFELNLEGKERVQDVYLETTTGYGLPTTTAARTAAAKNRDLGDNVAWAVGVQVGQNKKKGDWSGLLEFRQIGLGAVDQNINGTDYGDSYANQEGFKVSGAYNFTDFLTGTVTFYDTWDYKKNLYSSLGGTSATPANSTTLYLIGEKSLQRVQVDLGWKF